MPAAGPGALANSLQAGLEIHDPHQTAVAAGPSESAWHAVTEAGPHSIRVLPTNGTSGEYVLHVDVGPLGDMNLDGRFNMDDTQAVAAALRRPGAYQGTYGMPPAVRGDTDGDGDLDFDDIDEFVTLLIRGPEALFNPAAASVDRALSESSSESFWAPTWPVLGQHMNAPSQRTGQAEPAEAEALGDNVPIMGPRHAKAPRKLTPARSLGRDAARRSTATVWSTRDPASEEYEEAVWAEDGDWLLDVAEE